MQQLLGRGSSGGVQAGAPIKNIYEYLRGYERSPKTGRKKTIFDFKMKRRKKSRKRAKKKSRRRKKSRKLNSRRRKKNNKRFKII